MTGSNTSSNSMTDFAQAASKHLSTIMGTNSATKTMSGGRRGRKGRHSKTKKGSRKHRKKTHHRRKKRKVLSFNLF